MASPERTRHTIDKGTVSRSLSILDNKRKICELGRLVSLNSEDRYDWLSYEQFRCNWHVSPQYWPASHLIRSHDWFKHMNHFKSYADQMQATGVQVHKMEQLSFHDYDSHGTLNQPSREQFKHNQRPCCHTSGDKMNYACSCQETVKHRRRCHRPIRPISSNKECKLTYKITLYICSYSYR